MNMPEDVNFIFKRPPNAMNLEYAVDAMYAYTPDYLIYQKKYIILNPDFVSVWTLAHEMRHAHQQEEDLTTGSEIFFRSNDFKNPNEDFVLGKLQEMDTRLYDFLLQRELLQQNKFTGNVEEYPEFEFFDNLVKDGLKKGLSEQEAEKYARTSFVKAFWTNGKDVDKALFPEKLKPIISNWNAIYDLQTKKLTRRVQDTGNEKTEKAYELMAKYSKRMGVDIPAEYFMNLATKEFMYGLWVPKEITNIETNKDRKVYKTNVLLTCEKTELEILDQEIKKAGEENDTKKIEILTEILTGSTIGGPIKIEQTYTEENRDTDTQKNNAMRNILKEQNTR